MKKGIKTRKSRFENLEERLMMAVAAGGFASAAECVASEAVNDEFIPINLGEPLQTGACPCDNPLPAPTILTGSKECRVSYGQNNHLIAWSEVENAAGYELEYVNGKGEWFTVKTTEDHAVVANLAYGTNVTYRVRALGDAIYGSSAWSAAKSFNVCPMDIDEDGLIGPDDYALLSSAWFSAEDGANWNPCCDIDGDGFVGPGDFSYLSSNWLKDTGDEGLSYPAVEKLTITVPDSALTVPSIMKDSANLSVRVRVDASQIRGIEAGNVVEIFAVGTYENAENDTDENVASKVTVVFSVSGRDAYRYNPIPPTTVTGEVYPFSSVALTCDPSKITWGDNKAVGSGQQDVPVTLEDGAISGILASDIDDLVVTAVAHYNVVSTVNETGSDLENVSVEIRFTISGTNAQGYYIDNINTTGTISAIPIMWYTGIIPKVYIETDGVTNWHTNPYATNINDLAVLNDANSDGVSDDDKDIQTIINGLSGKTLYSGTRSASNASSLTLTFGYNDADWETALNNSGVIEEVREEFDMYEGYPFILTNQGDSFSIENLNHDPITFSKVLSNVVVDGVTLSGYLRTDVEAGDGFVGLSVKFDA